MTTLDREITVLEALTSYLAGSAPLTRLADTTAATLFELAPEASGPLPDLVRTIELHLAEYTSGDLSKEELRRLLSDMTHNYRLELLLDDSQTRQHTGTTSMTVGEAYSWSRPGTPLAVAFA